MTLCNSCVLLSPLNAIYRPLGLKVQKTRPSTLIRLSLFWAVILQSTTSLFHLHPPPWVRAGLSLLTDRDSFISIQPTWKEKGGCCCRVLANKLAITETTGRNEIFTDGVRIVKQAAGWRWGGSIEAGDMRKEWLDWMNERKRWRCAP